MRIKCTKNKCLILILSSILCAILIYLMYPIQDSSYMMLFNYTYCFVNFKSYASLSASAIKWIFPQLLIILLWGNYLEENFIENADVILTRTKHIRKYIYFTCGELFALVLVTNIILFLTLYTVMLSFTNHIVIDGQTILNIFIYIEYSFLTVIVVNCISVLGRAAYGVLVILGTKMFLLEAIKLIIDSQISNKLLAFIPTFHVMFVMQEKNLTLNSFFSIVYFIILIIIIVESMISILQNKEIL